jgi:hypothetical protein
MVKNRSFLLLLVSAYDPKTRTDVRAMLVRPSQGATDGLR